MKNFSSKFCVEYICFGAKSVLGKYTFGWHETHGNFDIPVSHLSWTNCQIDQMMPFKKRRGSQEKLSQKKEEKKEHNKKAPLFLGAQQRKNLERNFLLLKIKN